MIMQTVASVLLASVLFTQSYRLQRSLRLFKIRKQYSAAIEAPSVSICIPARNETNAMTQCLERVLASDYRKMEVIVFDDESKDDTSILIKSFAHAGVRFVSGAALPPGWLGKNHALDVLAREASGTYIIFLDVDTHIQPTTISQLVGYMTAENIVMTSVIPERVDTWRASVLFGYLRYFWQLVRSTNTRPSTSSSLWMIKRHTLLRTIGGLERFKATVEPESNIATLIGSRGYHCLVSDEQMGVSYEKKWLSQQETSRRLLYPMFGGGWLGACLGLSLLLLMNIPMITILSAFVTGWSIFHGVALVFLLGFSSLYCRYTYATWRGHWWLALFVWPFVVFQELLVMLSSVVGYARNTITWKGRRVLSEAEGSR